MRAASTRVNHFGHQPFLPVGLLAATISQIVAVATPERADAGRLVELAFATAKVIRPTAIRSHSKAPRLDQPQRLSSGLNCWRWDSPHHFAPSYRRHSDPCRCHFQLPSVSRPRRSIAWQLGATFQTCTGRKRRTQSRGHAGRSRRTVLCILRPGAAQHQTGRPTPLCLIRPPALHPRTISPAAGHTPPCRGPRPARNRLRDSTDSTVCSNFFLEIEHPIW